MLITTVGTQAQNLNATNGGFSEKKEINGKKYRQMFYEYEINKTVDEVWAEVSGNYINVGDISQSITHSHCESGDTTEGLGAKRFCAIDFSGKEVRVKERIIEFKESDNRKAYTYEVYESQGFPARVFNTWIVRKGNDGKTYLGNVFTFRAKPGFLTGMMAGKLRKLKATRNGVLAYKHYLETGEKKVDPEIFDTMYPEPTIL